MLRRNIRLNRQTTLARSVSLSGHGLHTAAKGTLHLRPATAYSGIVFRRSDLGDFDIPANVEHVAQVSYATTLMRQGVMISTVEHVLSALAGCQVDNCFVDIDSLEVPILDGSADPFIRLIREAGIVELPERRKFLQITRPVEVVEGDKRLAVEPADHFSIDCVIAFEHPLIGKQKFQLSIDNGNYEREIAPARTFGFMRDVENLQRNGLIRGGSLENAIVLDDENILNQEGLRFADEFVRHKILDIIGDMSLFGFPLLGHVTAERSGHAMHTMLVAKVLRDRRAWEIVEAPALQSRSTSNNR